jgi:hypothetical protein
VRFSGRRRSICLYAGLPADRKTVEYWPLDADGKVVAKPKTRAAAATDPHLSMSVSLIF